MTSSSLPRKRRAVIVPPGYVTLTGAAARLSISLSTLRRSIRPADPALAAMWAQRLDIRQRQRPGNLMPVFYLSIARLDTWAHALTGVGMPLVDPSLLDEEEDKDDDC